MKKNRWEVKKLGEVIQLEYGKPLADFKRKPDGMYPVYGANGVKDRTNEFYSNKKSIIVGRKGSAGEITLTEEKFWPLDVTYFVTFDDKNNDLFFIYYLLNNLELKKLAKGVKPGINRNDVYSIEIPHPPLPEQQRIVKILDQTFFAVDQMKERVEKNLKHAKAIFEAELQKIFLNPLGHWEVKKLGEVCKTGSGGTPLKSKKQYYDNGNIPWIMSGEVNQTEIYKANYFITELGLNNSSAKLFPVDTVLIAMYGATAGQVGILKFSAATNQAICGVLPNKNLLPKLVYYYFTFIKSDLLKLATGNAQPNISQIKIKNQKILLPPLPEQQRIVKHLDQLSELTKKLEAIYQKKLANLEELKKSILQKAFNGELTESTIEFETGMHA